MLVAARAGAAMPTSDTRMVTYNDAPENLEFGSSAYKLLIPWLTVYTEKSPGGC